MSTNRLTKLWTICGAVCVALQFTGCGGEAAPGPSVVGFQLPDAEKQLDNAGIHYTVKSNGLFGVLVEENWTVCKEVKISDVAVRLEVSKTDC